MNREVDKEKDIHDGICLTLFILFLFFLLIMIGRHSFVLSDPLPDEQLVIDGTEEILPTFDPNHPTITVNPSGPSKTVVSNVTYQAPKKEEPVYDNTQDVSELKQWVSRLLESIQGSAHPELVSIKDKLDGYFIELSKIDFSKRRVEEMNTELKEIESKIQEINNTNLAAVLVRISSFTIYSSVSEQAMLEQLISYLPDSLEKDEFFLSLHQFDSVFVSSEEELLSAFSSELVSEIHFMNDIMTTEDITIQTPKLLDGEGYQITGADISIFDTVVSFHNVSLNLSLSIVDSDVSLEAVDLLDAANMSATSSTVSFIDVHNSFETIENPSITGIDSVLSGDVTTAFVQDSIYGYVESYRSTVTVSNLDELEVALWNPFCTNIILAADLVLTSDMTATHSVTIDVNGYSFDCQTFEILGDVTWIGMDLEEEEDDSSDISSDDDCSYSEESDEVLSEDEFSDDSSDSMVEESVVDDLVEKTTTIEEETLVEVDPVILNSF